MIFLNLKKIAFYFFYYFFFQWLVGFCGLLFPGFRPPIRASYVLTHKFVGRVIFCLSLVNILIGINKISAGTTLMNVAALFVLLYALNGGYILAKNAFAREAVDDCHGDEPVYERGGDTVAEEDRYINISAGGSGGGGGQYHSMDDNPIVKDGSFFDQ